MERQHGPDREGQNNLKATLNASSNRFRLEARAPHSRGRRGHNVAAKNDERALSVIRFLRRSFFPTHRLCFIAPRRGRSNLNIRNNTFVIVAAVVLLLSSTSVQLDEKCPAHGSFGLFPARPFALRRV
jgi:hypothetical protein